MLRIGLAIVLLAVHALTTAATPEAEIASSGCSHWDSNRQVFFGDLHVHTRYSLDASSQGTRTTPEQAYEFALGNPLGIQPWRPDGTAARSVQLARPLDFAMVSDHAELLGEVALCEIPGATGYWSWECFVHRHVPIGAYYLFNYKANIDGERLAFCGQDGEICRGAAKGPWAETIMAAERFNVGSPDCTFTAFAGFEWTGMDAETGGNLHRNVIFNGALPPDLPLSFIDYPTPVSLWKGLNDTCREADRDCDALIVPHNSNLSAGLMFPTLDKEDADPRNAAMRADYEVLLEIMQHKGSSECFFAQGVGADELCAFEQLPTGSMMGARPPEPTTGFAREVLREGLRWKRQIGVNPYALGFIASTDTHLGTPGATAEDNFPGHGGAGPSSRSSVPPGLPDNSYYNPGGLAVIWAEENSRDSLFNAMKRREVYGTSGTRIIARMFGGWSLSPELCQDPDMIAKAYASGVPMGGNLERTQTEHLSGPTFLVAAMADNGGITETLRPLQRIQIIKSWIDENGRSREKIYDVAGDAANGATVNLSNCEQNGPGVEHLCAVWADEAFDATTDAYYYSRILEDPSCRWSQRICNASGVDCANPETIGPGLDACCSGAHNPIVQERAWTSPIFYYAGDAKG